MKTFIRLIIPVLISICMGFNEFTAFAESTAYTWALDCWTPAGMLSLNLTDDVSIDGNVYDDWHIGPTY